MDFGCEEFYLIVEIVAVGVVRAVVIDVKMGEGFGCVLFSR